MKKRSSAKKACYSIIIASLTLIVAFSLLFGIGNATGSVPAAFGAFIGVSAIGVYSIFKL